MVCRTVAVLCPQLKTEAKTAHVHLHIHTLNKWPATQISTDKKQWHSPEQKQIHTNMNNADRPTLFFPFD